MPLTFGSDLPFFTRYEKLFQASVIFQAALLVFAATILDEGEALRFFMLAAVAYWCAVAIIMVRRNGNASWWDRVLLVGGYPLMLPLTAVLLAMEPVGWLRR